MKLVLAPVLNLLHSAHASTLATQFTLMTGYPYATVIPNVLDEQHRPILLISALAEHTKNLLADPKVSISVTKSGVPNVQDGQRLTLIGDAEQFEPDDALKARYLRYLPAAEQYLMLDFMFFRIQPKRLRYIGGVGKMGWVETEVLAAIPSLSLADEATLLAEAQAIAPRNVTLLGIDPFGIDYLADEFRDRSAFQGKGFSREVLLDLVPKLT
ncbi:MAG: pyridoxamine 5'-phosphate oxidase family protein [Azonexus sp.]|nr:pyridoxamine 5'-phosphate oxidase family protein [Azonexus sp.]MDZ4317108.1 pyridoxamine 5'-phosphate oxidase family protein [Azonexus sp.]